MSPRKAAFPIERPRHTTCCPSRLWGWVPDKGVHQNWIPGAFWSPYFFKLWLAFVPWTLPHRLSLSVCARQQAHVLWVLEAFTQFVVIILSHNLTPFPGALTWESLTHCSFSYCLRIKCQRTHLSSFILPLGFLLPPRPHQLPSLQASASVRLIYWIRIQFQGRQILFLFSLE